MENTERPDPTTISPVVEQQLALNRELTKAMPNASREEIAAVQEELQPAPDGIAIAAVETEPTPEEGHCHTKLLEA